MVLPKKAYPEELFSNSEIIEMEGLLACVTNSKSSFLNKIHFSYKLILTKPPPRLTFNKERDWFFLHMFLILSCKITAYIGQHIFTSDRKCISNHFPVSLLLWAYFRFLTLGFPNNLNYNNT